MPPLVGVAVKVTLVPAVMLPLGLAAILTDGVTGVAVKEPQPPLSVIPHGAHPAKSVQPEQGKLVFEPVVFSAQITPWPKISHLDPVH